MNQYPMYFQSFAAYSTARETGNLNRNGPLNGLAGQMAARVIVSLAEIGCRFRQPIFERQPVVSNGFESMPGSQHFGYQLAFPSCLTAALCGASVIPNNSKVFAGADLSGWRDGFVGVRAQPPKVQPGPQVFACELSGFSG